MLIQTLIQNTMKKPNRLFKEVKMFIEADVSLLDQRFPIQMYHELNITKVVLKIIFLYWTDWFKSIHASPILN